MPTASGDGDRYVADFYRAFSAYDCRPSDLQLFIRSIEDLETFVLEQDVVYVGGGSTANLLAVWRVHGLGLLGGSCCPHYDGEPERRPTYERLVDAGILADGFGADDGAGLVFEGDQLAEVVASRPHAAAYRVERVTDGVQTERLEARYLG